MGRRPCPNPGPKAHHIWCAAGTSFGAFRTQTRTNKAPRRPQPIPPERAPVRPRAHSSRWQQQQQTLQPIDRCSAAHATPADCRQRLPAPLASDKLFYFLFQSNPDLILRWLEDLPADAAGYSFSAPVLKEREPPRWAVLTASATA